MFEPFNHVHLPRQQTIMGHALRPQKDSKISNPPLLRLRSPRVSCQIPKTFLWQLSSLEELEPDMKLGCEKKDPEIKADEFDSV